MSNKLVCTCIYNLQCRLENDYVVRCSPALWPPHRYGHIVVILSTLLWPAQKLCQSFSYVENPFYMATLLIMQEDFCGPLVTGQSQQGYILESSHEFLI